ncbi:hypothetical protein KIPB_014312, partial [Kipferlia bialata]
YLRETPYAPVADRSGTLHRMFLPDHGYIMDAAIAFFTHCMRDDPLFEFLFPDRARNLEMIHTVQSLSAWAAARYGSLWMLIPDGAEVTHFSGGMIGAAPGHSKPVLHIPMGAMISMMRRC